MATKKSAKSPARPTIKSLLETIERWKNENAQLKYENNEWEKMFHNSHTKIRDLTARVDSANQEIKRLNQELDRSSAISQRMAKDIQLLKDSEERLQKSLESARKVADEANMEFGEEFVARQFLIGEHQKLRDKVHDMVVEANHEKEQLRKELDVQERMKAGLKSLISSECALIEKLHNDLEDREAQIKSLKNSLNALTYHWDFLKPIRVTQEPVKVNGHLTGEYLHTIEYRMKDWLGRTSWTIVGKYVNDSESTKMVEHARRKHEQAENYSTTLE